MKKLVTFVIAVALILTTALGTVAFAAPAEESSLAMIDMSAWQYDESSDVYWQVGISYCAAPVDEAYESMGIYVPGAYFNATDNGDGTYTCEVNTEGTAGAYTIETAPYVLPVNTAGYSAQKAPTGFTKEAGTYAAEGIIYIYPGCRGRDSGAPAGATDLKAAIRFVRANDDVLPGDTEKVFVFGHSGGGAQSAVVAASGNAADYDKYLEAIGAVMDESDAVFGAMCWCPITNLDFADEAYEWNLGLAREDLIPEMEDASRNLAAFYAEYINDLGLEDAEGNLLILEETEDGYYQAGTYYDYVIAIIEDSINDFLSVTEFPFTPGTPSSGPGGGGMPTKETAAAETEAAAEGDSAGGSGDSAGETAGAGEKAAYENAKDYIESLNESGEWIEYDEATNTVKVTSLAGFAKAAKAPSKDVGAFDSFDLSAAENTVFGEGNGAEHFDVLMALALDGTEYAEQFAVDDTRVDALGTTLADRIAMYTPLNYICEVYQGYGQAEVAQFWRIRSGISQGDTSLNTEINLAAALAQYGCDVDFATIWQKGHETAELTGSSTDNFIAWIAECLGAEAAEDGESEEGESEGESAEEPAEAEEAADDSKGDIPEGAELDENGMPVRPVDADGNPEAPPDADPADLPEISDSSVAGTYTYDETNAFGLAIAWTLVLSEDGSYALTEVNGVVAGGSATYTGTYTADGNAVTCSKMNEAGPEVYDWASPEGFTLTVDGTAFLPDLAGTGDADEMAAAFGGGAPGDVPAN